MIIALLMGMIVGIFFGAMKREEAQQTAVTLEKNEDRTVVFYKDDCPDCQSVFPYLYFRHLFINDVVLVNLNQPKNRPYINQFNVTSVPTFIHGEQRYQGTKLKEIETVFDTKEE